MLSLILGFITGLAGPISNIVGRITDLQQAKIKARSDNELAQINQDIEAAHDKRAVLIAEAWSRLNAVARFILFALPSGIVIWKLAVWDKVVGSFIGCSGPDTANMLQCVTFRTDALGELLGWVIIACVGFYTLASKRS